MCMNDETENCGSRFGQITERWVRCGHGRIKSAASYRIISALQCMVACTDISHPEICNAIHGDAVANIIAFHGPVPNRSAGLLGTTRSRAAGWRTTFRAVYRLPAVCTASRKQDILMICSGTIESGAESCRVQPSMLRLAGGGTACVTAAGRSAGKSCHLISSSNVETPCFVESRVFSNVPTEWSCCFF